MRVVIPASAWEAAVTALRRPPHDRERVVYLDGPRPEGRLAVVTTVTVPQADEHEGQFRVEAQEMSRAGRHLRHLGLMRLAQLHSHPSSWTGHSPYDDEMAFSQRDGALSIVVPFFAGCAPGLLDCGVHVRGPGGWRELHADEVSDVIQVVPSMIDLRS